MKVVIEYGTGKNTIIISKVRELSELPFAYLIQFFDDTSINIAKDRIHSMEIIPDA